MQVSHAKAHPSMDPSPYTISTDKNTVRVGESLTVTVKGINDTVTFAGFLVQARKDDKILGKFRVTDDAAKTMNCSGLDDSVTHTGKGQRSQWPLQKISFMWQPPENYHGEVKFRLSIVESYRIFWTEIDSAPVKVL